jgi:pimeloyl-ACP methyl ester carboxylesterase
MKLVVSGLLTHYTQIGEPSAPVVVALHGWGASSQNFDGLSKHLAGRFRVLCLDLPGFGGTQAPPEPWHIIDYAHFVRAFLEKLDIQQVEAMIGHSFGGRVSIKATAQGVVSPNHIILIGSAGVAHTRTLRNQVFKVMAKTGKAVTALPGLSQVRAKLRRRLYDAAGSQDYVASGELRQTFLNTINEDLQADAAAITIPALLIWGANDIDTPPADGRILAGHMSYATFSLVADAGHYTHLDAPDRVYALIDEFLK